MNISTGENDADLVRIDERGAIFCAHEADAQHQTDLVRGEHIPQ